MIFNVTWENAMKKMLLFILALHAIATIPMEMRVLIHNQTGKQWSIYSWANNFKDQVKRELTQQEEPLLLKLAKKDLNTTQVLAAAVTVIDPESKTYPMLTGRTKEKIYPLVTLRVHLSEKLDSCEQMLETHLGQGTAIISEPDPIDLINGAHNITAYLYLRGNNLENSQLILASEISD